jgi:hypothetical protein
LNAARGCACAWLFASVVAAASGCAPRFHLAFETPHFEYYVEAGASDPCPGAADWIERYGAAVAQFMGQDPDVWAQSSLLSITLAPRAPALDADLVATPRLRIALGRGCPGTAYLGVPVTAVWTLRAITKSANFVEPADPPLGLAIGGELGIALSF